MCAIVQTEVVAANEVVVRVVRPWTLSRMTGCHTCLECRRGGIGRPKRGPSMCNALTPTCRSAACDANACPFLSHRGPNLRVSQIRGGIRSRRVIAACEICETATILACRSTSTDSKNAGGGMAIHQFEIRCSGPQCHSYRCSRHPSGRSQHSERPVEPGSGAK